MKPTASPNTTKVRLTLDVSYNPAVEDHPANWDWPGLLGRNGPEEASIEGCEAPTRAIKPVINAADMPIWCSWAAMDYSGIWYGYDSTPIRRAVTWSAPQGGYMVRIPDYCAPKWEGEWTESLVKFRN